MCACPQTTEFTFSLAVLFSHHEGVNDSVFGYINQLQELTSVYLGEEKRMKSMIATRITSRDTRVPMPKEHVLLKDGRLSILQIHYTDRIT